VGKPEGRRPLGRPRHWWSMILRWILEMGWCGMEWIDLAQDRNQWRAFMNMVMNLWVP
jgi:hypothetical protein